jgi:ATP-dependent Clp protease ATP-binding subunit ClpA
MPTLALLDPTRTGTQAESLEKKVPHLIIGQDEAIHQIVRTYQTYLAGLSPVGRPNENFLFFGPTGSGKTRTVEAITEALVGNPRAVIKIDCAEFQHSHESAKLIGSVPDSQLEFVQQRIQSSGVSWPFFIDVVDGAREFLLTEGTDFRYGDFRYGARPLKRAIEHLLVQPLSNLMVTDQIHSCDCIGVTHTDESPFLTFLREANGLESGKLIAWRRKPMRMSATQKATQ